MKDTTKQSLDLYVSEGYRPGGFLTAVLENNLMQAFSRADEDNRNDMFDIVTYVYNKMPSGSHGSPEKVSAWVRHEGQKGWADAPARWAQGEVGNG